jgi:hypothetical protein
MKEASDIEWFKSVLVLGRLGVLVWDYEKGEQLLNLLIEPGHEQEKISAFDKLQSLLL